MMKKRNNGLFFPVFKPEVSWNPAVMFVDFAISTLPVVKLAGNDPKPDNKDNGSDSGFIGPVINEINNGIADVVGNPNVF